MLQRKPVTLPSTIYPIDQWRIVEKRFTPDLLQETETIFTVANGYLGMRGCHEEGTPTFENGTYINGFFEIWPITYGEEAYGYAKEGQTIVNVTDTKTVRLFVDDEPFLLPDATLLSYERTLDMRRGTLERVIVWQTQSGKRVAIRSRRLVSYADRHLAAVVYEVTVPDGMASVLLISEAEHDDRRRFRTGDPRLHHAFKRRAIVPEGHAGNDGRAVLGHRTEQSGLRLVCGIDHEIDAPHPVESRNECVANRARVAFAWDAQPGVTVTLTKFIAYHTSGLLEFDALHDAVGRGLDRARTDGIDALLEAQKRQLDAFWQRGDVIIEEEEADGNDAGALQQALRFNLFQIFQASVQVGDASIPAKGLTGQAYDGNYFWDTEAYVLPFLMHTEPHLARNLLDFRYRMLDKARQRANEVNERGALFPWRTIDGEEASANYASSTAQYHINGDIAYALQKYVGISGDEEFLFDKGAEILAETARMWVGLGFFSERHGGRFCIHGVTGPDEYTTVVNNNLYTNLIARNNLQFAAETLSRMQRDCKDRYEIVAARIGLNGAEIADWRRAVERMYVPYDEELRVHPQDDVFLDKKVWDFAGTPDDQYPLLLHFHPLVIYRHQVIKQADVVLAMVFLGDQFSPAQKRRNFEYYDPLTTGDSSLSVSIQSILAAEIGEMGKALEYGRYGILMDLGNVEGNVKDGCHIASLGGSWMLCTYGFAGMREYDGVLSFAPRLPRGIKRMSFSLLVRQCLLAVDIGTRSVIYRLRDGASLRFRHRETEIHLSAGQEVSIRLDR